MSYRAPYPNAVVLAHPNMSAAQAERLCHVEGLDLIRTECGNFRLAPKPAPQSPRKGSGVLPSPLISSADAGPKEAA